MRRGAKAWFHSRHRLSTGWAYFVYEAYQDINHLGVFNEILRTIYILFIFYRVRN